MVRRHLLTICLTRLNKEPVVRPIFSKSQTFEVSGILFLRCDSDLGDLMILLLQICYFFKLLSYNFLLLILIHPVLTGVLHNCASSSLS